MQKKFVKIKSRSVSHTSPFPAFCGSGRNVVISFKNMSGEVCEDNSPRIVTSVGCAPSPPLPVFEVSSVLCGAQNRREGF